MMFSFSVTLLLCLVASATKADSVSDVYWPFDYLGYGYDIVYDLPTAPIIQLSFKENRTFHSTTTGLTYQIPDQAEIMEYPQSALSKGLNIIRNITEYQHVAYSYHNFGFGFFGLFGFMFSHEAGDVKDILKDGTDVVYIANKQFQFFDIATWPLSALNQKDNYFEQSINALPATYNTDADKQAYRKWVKFFGTNFFERARYGGDIRYYIVVNSTIFQKQTEQWVSHQVGLYVTFMDIKFGFDFGKNITRQNISNEFWENSRALCRFRPFGDTLQDCDNLTTIGFRNWVDMAMKQPVLLAPTLRNISELVSNDQKRVNMETAIAEYLENPNATEVIAIRDMRSIPPPAKKINVEKPKAGLPVIPGYNIIGMGLNAATMDFTVLPVVSLLTTENNTYNCNSNNQYGPGCWQNPFYPDYKFFVPWNVYLENTPSSNLVNGSQIFTSFDDYQKYYSHTTSHHSFFGSKSKTVYHFYEKYFEEDSAFVFVYQSRSWYKLTLPPLPPPQLDPRVAAVINGLPSVYNPQDANTVRLYRNAIQALGTHFIYSAMFGGVEQMVAWFHKCLLSTYSVDWVKEQSGWSFFGLIYDNSGKYNYDSKLNENFVQWSESTIEYIGGKAFEYEPGDFNNWVNTLKDRPVPTWYDVLPVSLIIEDKTKSASYAQAVHDYMLEAHNTTVAAQDAMSAKDPWTKPSWCHWKDDQMSTPAHH